MPIKRTHDHGDGTYPQGVVGPLLSTLSAFDKVGNMTALQDASNNLTQFVYDRLNRQSTEIDPFGKPLKYEYDFAGNLTAIVNRVSTGRRREYTYDNLDRVTKELWKSLSGASIHSIHYAYDTAGRLDTVKELRGAQSGVVAEHRGSGTSQFTIGRLGLCTDHRSRASANSEF